MNTIDLMTGVSAGVTPELTIPLDRYGFHWFRLAAAPTPA
jgi:hypothetical protein